MFQLLLSPGTQRARTMLPLPPALTLAALPSLPHPRCLTLAALRTLPYVDYTALAPTSHPRTRTVDSAADRPLQMILFDERAWSLP